MDWKKIVEQVVTVVLSMVLTGFGGAMVWGITTILQHERELANKGAQIMLLEEAMRVSKERDKELISLMAEEIKKLQAAVEESCAHMTGLEPEMEPAQPYTGITTEPIPKVVPEPAPPSPKEPKEAFNKFFPQEQKVEDYQRILRDKFNQRTDQMQQRTR